MPQFRFLSPFILTLFLVFSSTGCGRDSEAVLPPNTPPPTDRNVIVLVIDGARYTEMFGDSNYKYIPRLRSLMRQGTTCTNLYIDGETNTVNGHSVICTGNYESLNNGGAEYPTYASFFQYWKKAAVAGDSTAWIITSKDKLEVLSDCKDVQWHGKHRPNTDCGVNGLATGYREDSITINSAMRVLQTGKPKLMLINLKEPDVAGHMGDWPLYLDGIRKGDAYAYQLWTFIQGHPQYRNNTVLLITNDHGRHSDGWSNGFVSHGDNCNGCRHINFLALGPDIRKGHIDTSFYSQNDIAATIAKILGIEMPHCSGKIMAGILD
ncbi:MAG: alkaline phosphatase family protein [Bacteroidota bacterium]